MYWAKDWDAFLLRHWEIAGFFFYTYFKVQKNHGRRFYAKKKVQVFRNQSKVARFFAEKRITVLSIYFYLFVCL